eukprot:CAMPEP_0171996840 /NCGR_PEP_ID=MMETSP1041-20130122/365_1 /TAXON_ID=464988 /ORGANISM="Hemiselmis andersenii, Strain CCMP439" /LENGTH=42 /DNA_ID= /DNA_START= /DNA_END= /DNA_ORIENTATION=
MPHDPSRARMGCAAECAIEVREQGVGTTLSGSPKKAQPSQGA